MANRIDLTGKRFGKVVVIEAIEGSCTLKANLKWKCKCDCGIIKNIIGQSLRRGSTTSCGCSNGDQHWTGYGELSGRYFGRIIISAKTRNLSFTLTKKYLWNLFLKQNKRCTMSNITLTFERADKRRTRQTASLDRIDSSKGYIEGNVQWVHKDVNKMKNNASEEDFLKYVGLIAKHRNL